MLGYVYIFCFLMFTEDERYAPMDEDETSNSEKRVRSTAQALSQTSPRETVRMPEKMSTFSKHFEKRKREKLSF